MIEENRPLKVFLCHARADRDAVRGLYSRLTKDGVDAWLSSRSPKGLSRTEQGISIPLTHAHADRDPVRALPEGARLTKDGVDAWLLARSPKGLPRTEQGILSRSPTPTRTVIPCAHCTPA